MKFLVYESLGELLILIGSAVGAVVLTLVGALTEQASLQSILTGHFALGLWEAGMGALALFVGVYLLGYREFWRRLRRARRPA